MLNFEAIMRQLPSLFLWATLLSGTHGASIGAATFSNSSLSFPIPNTFLHYPPDPRFSLQPRYTTIRLPATAILMNTVSLLAEAADLDIDAHLEFDRHGVFPEYPTVTIDLQTSKNRDRLQNFMLVWTLYEAAWDMIAKNSFFVCEFDIMWKGRVVARLRYGKAPEGGGEFGQRTTDGRSETFTREASTAGHKASSSAINNTVVEAESANTTSTIPPLPLISIANEAIALNLKYLNNGENIPIFTVFMTVLATLTENAFYPAAALVEPFHASTPGFDAQISIMRNAGSPDQRPPFFERTILTQAMRQLPGFMLMQRRFAEVAFTITVEGRG